MSTSTTPSGPRLGVTTYSFTPGFHGLEYDFETLVRQIAARNLGPGLEVVGFQSFRDFPSLDTSTVDRFHALIEETGLQPSCLAINGDVGIRPDRLATDEEAADYMRPQVEAAALLGFPVARLQKTLSTRTLELLLPRAEELGVTLAYEIHSPDSVATDWVLRLRDLYDRLDSPHVGFIPDWGSSVRQPAPTLWSAFRARGVSERVLAGVEAEWYRGHSAANGREEGEMIHHFQALARELGGDDVAAGLAIFAVGIFGHQDPQQWAEIAPWIRHVHGKFFGFDDEGSEPSIPTQDVLKVLVDSGYQGFISSEWEGWHWDYSPDAFDMVTRHHQLSRRVLDDLLSPVLGS